MQVELAVSEIQIPISPAASENPVRTITLKIEKRHAVIVQRLVSGLISKGATLESGRPVRSHHAAALWLIEEIGRNER